MAACGIDHIDLMKVDIEGSEIERFDTISDDLLDRIDQMTVEFHDFLPEYELAAKVRATLDRLIGLGWLSIVFSRRDHSDVLLINRKKTFSKFVPTVLPQIPRKICRRNAEDY
jgi:hypothetical protein